MDKAKKASPLLLLVLLSVATIVVGAFLFELFKSGPTTGIYKVDTDVRGLKAQLIQAGSWTSYTDPFDSTSLATQTHGPTPSTFASDCAILVVHDYDLPTEDLTLTISVFEVGTEQSVTYTGPWTCTATFVEFWIDTSGQITAHPDTPLSGQGPWVITHAQIDDLVYDSEALGQEGDYNALILSFVFDGETGVEYSASWDNDPNIDLPDEYIDVIVSLSTEG